MDEENYVIVLRGCDDSTHIPIYLKESEVALVELICKKSREFSEYACMPIMDLETKAEYDGLRRSSR
jgi:hypothetical protein